MSTEKTISKWIRIDWVRKSDTGVTDVWWVMNRRTNECIGEIRWYGANGFRGYCFFPTIKPDTAWMLFDAPCMRMIADFMDVENRQHRASKGVKL